MTDLMSTSSQNFAVIRGVGVGVLQHASRIEFAHGKRGSSVELARKVSFNIFSAVNVSLSTTDRSASYVISTLPVSSSIGQEWAFMCSIVPYTLFLQHSWELNHNYRIVHTAPAR